MADAREYDPSTIDWLVEFGPPTQLVGGVDMLVSPGIGRLGREMAGFSAVLQNPFDVQMLVSLHLREHRDDRYDLIGLEFGPLEVGCLMVPLARQPRGNRLELAIAAHPMTVGPLTDQRSRMRTSAQVNSIRMPPPTAPGVIVDVPGIGNRRFVPAGRSGIVDQPYMVSWSPREETCDPTVAIEYVVLWSKPGAARSKLWVYRIDEPLRPGNRVQRQFGRQRRSLLPNAVVPPGSIETFP